jgi:dCMP deaminase
MNNKWRSRYIGLAIEVGEFSEDTSTKVGSYIANPQTNRPVSFGYNGLPSGVIDKPERHERPTKYFYFEHAERNAIYNADKQLDHMAIFVTHTPCPDCTRAIIQNRIAELYILTDNGFASEWSLTRYSRAELTAIHEMLTEAKVKIFEIDRDGNLA